MTRHAFAPGHVTGFFAVHRNGEKVSQQGSRGGGWSLNKGAWATVDLAELGQETTIRINGDQAEATVTKHALNELTDVALRVDLHLDLPVGQGFGMSAAGTLAACLAATSLLELEPEEALRVTHEAEVMHSTGLGDAVGSWFGAAELRIKPGCPPDGWAMHIQVPANTAFLFCVLGSEVDTAQIIDDLDWQARTRDFGDSAVDRVMDAGREGSWTQLLQEAAAFTKNLGLRPASMTALQEPLPEGLVSGQCMLGTTLWVTGALGDLDRAEAMLEAHGNVLRASVDPNGARLVRSVRPA